MICGLWSPDTWKKEKPYQTSILHGYGRICILGVSNFFFKYKIRLGYDFLRLDTASIRLQYDSDTATTFNPLFYDFLNAEPLLFHKTHLLLFFSTLMKLKPIFFSSPHYVTTENKAAKWFSSASTWFFFLVDGFASHLQRCFLLDDGFFFNSSLHWQFCKHSSCRWFSSSSVPIIVVSCLWVCLLCYERCLV